MYKTKVIYHPLKSFLNNENKFFFLFDVYNQSNLVNLESDLKLNQIYEKYSPILAPTYTISHINHIPWTISYESLTNVSVSPISQNYAVTIADITKGDQPSLELIIVTKFKKFKEVQEIYIDHDKNDLTTVKVKLQIETYDFDLMNNIFNEAEFPIKDNSPDLLIDFKYIPSIKTSTDLINPQIDKQIYDRKKDEILEEDKKQYYFPYSLRDRLFI